MRPSLSTKQVFHATYRGAHLPLGQTQRMELLETVNIDTPLIKRQGRCRPWVGWLGLGEKRIPCNGLVSTTVADPTSCMEPFLDCETLVACPCVLCLPYVGLHVREKQPRVLAHRKC